MQSSEDRFRSFLVSERDRHAKRSHFAAIMAALIAVLLYQTQWAVLRPGLVILLVGQAGIVLALVLRNAKISKELKRPEDSAMEETPFSAWFKGEESFLTHLARFETACQMIGFVTLGCEIWLPTRSLWLALAIGVVYPATAYFGMMRRRNREAIRRLRTGKQ